MSTRRPRAQPQRNPQWRDALARAVAANRARRRDPTHRILAEHRRRRSVDLRKPFRLAKD
jgi:hypothetical protein